MNKKIPLLTAGWLATTAAAFYLGQSKSQGGADSVSSTANPISSSRVTTRSTNANHEEASSRSSLKNSTPRSSRAQIDEIGDLMNISDPIARTRAFLELVQNLSPSEFEDAVVQFRSLGMTRQRMGEYAMLLSAWAKVDPLAALKYGQENTETNFARQTILATWAQDSPAAAIAWARENFEGGAEQSNPWLVGIIRGIANTDLTQATDLLTELPYSRGRGIALGSIIAALDQQGPEVSKNWVASLDDARLQAGAAARIAERLGESDPIAALDWASSLGDNALQRAAPEVIESWAREDKDAALSWLDQQDDQIRSSAAPEMVRNLSIDEAQSFLDDHAGKPDYDRAIQTLARRAMAETPELGADWIMRMSNDRQRTRTFHRVLGDWMRRDRDGLIEYVNNNPVPESISGRLNREFSGG